MICLPFPPTTNNLFINVGKRRVVSKAYAAWRTKASAALLTQTPARIAGPYVMTLTLDRPDRIRRDCTNYIKAPEDFIVSAGLVDDDSLAERVTVEWSKRAPAKPGQVCITLEAA